MGKIQIGFLVRYFLIGNVSESRELQERLGLSPREKLAAKILEG